jgi:hypothetical protein
MKCSKDRILHSQNRENAKSKKSTLSIANEIIFRRIRNGHYTGYAIFSSPLLLDLS